MNWKGKKVLVLGLGVSGMAAAEKLHALGAMVRANDGGDSPELQKEAERLRSMGMECHLGSHPLEMLEDQELVVVSPGIAATHPLVAEAEKRGIPVWSEIELAWRFVRVPVIAVTGTNGKTTTVHMVDQILRRGGLKVRVAGNIGYPMVRAADELEGCDYLLTEVSSFQLAHIVDFAPRIAVVLNVRDDHFDWHIDFQDYLRAKSRIWMNQGPDDYLICNLDDENSVKVAQDAPAQQVYFSKKTDPLASVYLSGGRIVGRVGLGKEMALELSEVMRVERFPLPGAHNLENALAAVTVGLLAGVRPGDIAEALAGFQGLPHRLELVKEVDGVKYYDDSKATNPDAALRAIEAFEAPLIPILGGKNKGLSFEELAGRIALEAEKGKVRGVVVMGEAAEELEDALRRSGVGANIYRVLDMTQAVAEAKRLSTRGDVVVLTPACASFDQYESYAERGDHFKELVNSLGGGGGR